MDNKKVASKALAIVLVGVLATSCVAGPNTLENVPGKNGKVAGFFNGFWDGAIAPITFVISLFNKDVEIYNANSSGWYPFGFMLGIGALSGGSSSAARSR